LCREVLRSSNVGRDNADLGFDRGHIEEVGAAAWKHWIDDGNSSACLRQPDRQIAADKSKAAGDQYSLIPIFRNR
jgi:hypothetical protein